MRAFFRWLSFVKIKILVNQPWTNSETLNHASTSMYLQSQFLARFFETFFNVGELIIFLGVYFSFQSILWCKFYAHKSKQDKVDSKIKSTKTWNILNFFVDYLFAYVERFDSFIPLILDEWCEIYEASCFVGNLNKLLKNTSFLYFKLLYLTIHMVKVSKIS